MLSTIKKLSPIIPYLAVLAGVYMFNNAFLAIGLYHAGMLLVMLIWKNQRPEYNVNTKLLKWVYMTFAVFAAGGVILYFSWPYFNPNSSMITDKLYILGINKQNWTAFSIYFCVVNAIIEEFFWRGYLGVESLRVNKNDMFFGGYHAFVLLAFTKPIWILPAFVVCAIGGWLWRIMHKISGGLTYPILTHVIADFSIVLAVYYRIYR